MRIISNSPQETKDIASNLSRYLKDGDVIALIGGIGSGKTVFVKGLAKGLGLKEGIVTSPTFVLMHQYRRGKVLLNHFDLYRLKDISQLREIGYEEYFYGDGITVIEWADRIREALPEQCLRVEFRIQGNNRRLLKLTPLETTGKSPGRKRPLVG